MDTSKLPELPDGYRYAIRASIATPETYYLVIEKKKFGLFWSKVIDEQIAFFGRRNRNGVNLQETAKKLWHDYQNPKGPLFQTGPINSRS